MESVTGIVQHYPWGDPSFIPNLLGIPPDGQPWAELWLGTHPNGQTRTLDGTELIDRTGQLPYLLKVLAAGTPLSLQTHPNAQQARDGYARGIYPDDRAKPELLYALTPFDALCGVRPVDLTLALLSDIGAHDLASLLAADGPGGALDAIYRGGFDPTATLAACATSNRIEAEWAHRLSRMYPCDPSVAATLLLNLVRLEPGQVIRLEAGNLHAYLGGAGIELMGASDNVVRGGLTTKHVDVDELLRVLDPTPLEKPVIEGASRFDLPTADVSLQIVEPGEKHTAVGDELAVDLDGHTWWYSPGDVVTVTSTTFVASDTSS